MEKGSATPRRREFPRYLLSRDVANFKGTIDAQFVGTSTIYTFGKGGAGFFSTKRAPILLEEEELTSVFLFPKFSKDLLPVKSRLVYIADQKLIHQSYFLYGVKFLDRNDPLLSNIVTFLEAQHQKGKLQIQPEIYQ